MSGGTDVFSATPFDPTTWSEHVTATFAADGHTVVAVTVDAYGSADVTLTGSIAAAGDTAEFTRISDDFQTGMNAVCDVSGGIVLTDGAGDYFAFFAQPFTTGHSYPAVSGFGHFSQTGSDPACFVAGTRIRTPDGLCPVEDLRPGDRVATVIGRLPARVIWIGSRRLRCDRHPRPWDVRPVRVVAGALAPNVPARDLYLSPDHALLIDGALVPVRHLLNGTTIVQTMQTLVTYHHVELARHDVLYAEGAPAESFLDTGNRASFASAVQLTADAQTGRAAACAPLLTDGPGLLDIQRHLLLRAHALGNRLGSDPALRIDADERPLTVRSEGPTYRVTVPAGTQRLRLDSLAARPAETMPGSLDHRTLGLCVVGLRLDGAVLALDDAALTDGWHEAEPERRWTAGSAILTLSPSEHARELTVMAIHQLRYWIARLPACRATDRPGAGATWAPHDETVMRRRSGGERFVLQFDDTRAHAASGIEQRRSPQVRGMATAAPGPRHREGNRHDHRLHFA